MAAKEGMKPRSRSPISLIPSAENRAAIKNMPATDSQEPAVDNVLGNAGIQPGTVITATTSNRPMIVAIQSSLRKLPQKFRFIKFGLRFRAKIRRCVGKFNRCKYLFRIARFCARAGVRDAGFRPKRSDWSRTERVPHAIFGKPIL